MAANVFGTLVHRMLQSIHETGEFPNQTDLKTCWLKMATGYVALAEAEALWVSRAAEMFQAYSGLEIASYETLATEAEFNLLLSDVGEEVAIRGFIDRICRADDGRILLVDYKTTRNFTANLPAYKRQLALYTAAAREVLGYVAEPLLVDMERNAIIRLTPQESVHALSEVRSTIREVVSNRRVAPAKPPCWVCTYRVNCPSSTSTSAITRR